MTWKCFHQFVGLFSTAHKTYHKEARQWIQITKKWIKVKPACVQGHWCVPLAVYFQHQAVCTLLVTCPSLHDISPVHPAVDFSLLPVCLLSDLPGQQIKALISSIYGISSFLFRFLPTSSHNKSKEHINFFCYSGPIPKGSVNIFVQVISLLTFVSVFPVKK